MTTLPLPPPLPVPEQARWQPLRLGLRNLYRYDHEEFHFSGGRLLLRGNNGTGKTRVLALTLPFLLDGEVSPSRVEPDGNRNRRIEWHLLLDKYPERTGYTWMEFGRNDGEVMHYCTIGCGMRAVQGHQGLRSRWFFVSRQRLGSGLDLATADGSPLGKEALREALGSQGTLFETAESYRHAVDEHLFGLGEHRYRALVDLLIELRRPQLSRELDEARVSMALSQALAPVGAEVLDVVAESYRALERERDEHLSIERAAASVAVFNQVQARAVQVHAVGLSDQVASAHTRYEDAQQALRSASEVHEHAALALRSARELLAATELGLAAAAGEVNALETSDTMRSAQHLARLTEDAAQAQASSEHAVVAAGAAGTQLERRQSRRADAQRQHATALAQGDQAAGGLRDAASAIGLERDLAAEAPAALAAEVAEALPQRQRAARALGASEQRLAVQERSLQSARERLVDAETRRDQSQAQAEAATEALAKEEATVLASTREHQRSLLVLQVGAQAVELMADWVREPAAQAPYGLLLSVAAGEVRSAWALERGGLLSQRATLTRRQEQLTEEAANLARGQDPGPPPPAWRTQPRGPWPGAPLWRLCEFQPSLGGRERAALEGALQGAGVLDAWVHPDGRLEVLEGESWLLPVTPPAPGASLADVLLPAIDAADADACAVSEPILIRILAGIRVAAAHTPLPESPENPLWVGLDGRWGAGALQGQLDKSEAEHLGAGARAATRRRRLGAIELELSGIRAELATISSTIASGEARLLRLAQELSAQPDTAGFLRAWELKSQRLEWLRESREAVAQRQTETASALTAVAASQGEHLQLAQDSNLERWIGRLAELREAIQHAELLLRDLRTVLERVRHAEVALEEAHAELELATQAHRQALELSTSRAALAASARSEAQTLQKSLGSSVAEMYRHLQEVRERLRTLGETRGRAERARSDAQGEVGRTGEAERQAQARLLELAQLRSEALQGLLTLSVEGLLSALGAELGPPLAADATDTRVLELARALRKDAGTLNRDAATADRLQAQVSAAAQELHAVLSASDLRPVSEVRHRLMIVRVPFQGQDRTTVELEVLLRADAASRQLLLSANERQVIENFLIDEAANELHHLLHRAEAWQTRVNQELALRPMSTGMALRFQWLPAEDGPDGLEAARERLLRPNHLWSPADRVALAEFLQLRIQAAREGLEGGTWQEQLAVALDYRRWHRFVIERRQDGRWLRLTSRTHGTGSGGEKAVSLTMPQFAAAAAHYHAAPLAPRLILLDEAFVGIDGDMRRKCLGLLSAFDLDVVMTSEREWGCYDTVPALSIYQLAASPDGGCVTATRYVWDGKERRRVDDVTP
jgi:uncharacterized protein (TIGR02680 family)